MCESASRVREYFYPKKKESKSILAQVKEVMEKAATTAVSSAIARHGHTHTHTHTHTLHTISFMFASEQERTRARARARAHTHRGADEEKHRTTRVSNGILNQGKEQLWVCVCVAPICMCVQTGIFVIMMQKCMRKQARTIACMHGDIHK